MKQRFYLILAGLFLLTLQLKAQAPNSLNYQGVARDANGNTLTNQSIGLRFTVHQSTSNGTSVYQETWILNTNDFGLFTVSIGAGTVVSGDFSTINWSTGNYFLQVEMDPSGGTNYTNMGTNQFLSVPYALYAQSAGNGGTTYTSGTGIGIAGSVISAKTGNAIWNANKLLGDSISITAPTAGQVLQWNGTAWVPTTQTVLTDATLIGDGTSANKLGLAQNGATNGQVLEWNGTAWAPTTFSGGGNGWNLTGNTGTTAGINFIGTTDGNDLVFKTNSSENMRISNSNGYVGIGTNSPGAQLEIDQNYNGGSIGILHLNSSGTESGISFLENNNPNGTQQYSIKDGDNGTGETYFAIHDETAGTVPFTIMNGSGNIGINTISPAQRLHVVETNNPSSDFGGYNFPIEVESQNGTNSGIYINGTTSNNGLAGMVMSGYTTAFYAGLNNNKDFRLAGVAGIDEGDLTNAKDGTAGVTVLTSNGNVGIGNISPAQLLHVVDINNNQSDFGGYNFQIEVEARDNGAGATNAGIYINGSSNDNGLAGIVESGFSTAFYSGLNNNSDYRIAGVAGIDAGDLTNAKDGTAGITVSESTGNVGIGTSSPAQALDVEGGNLQFAQALMPNGDAGTAGYVLQSNGPDVAPTWVAPSGGGGTPALTQNQIAFGDVGNLMTSSSNWTYDGNNVSLHNGNFALDNAQAIYMNGIGDGNWTISRNTGSGEFVTSNALTLTHANGPGEGMTIENDFGTTEFEILGSTGAITFNQAYTFPTSDGSIGQVLSTDGSGNVSWATPSGGGTPTLTQNEIGYGSASNLLTSDGNFMYDGNQATFNLVDNWGGLHVEGRSGGEASIALNPDNIGNGNAGQWILATNGSNMANTADWALYNAAFIPQPIYVSESTNAVSFNRAYTFPTTDGTSGQVLSTDGSGNLSWSSSSSGTVTSVGSGFGLQGGAITTTGTLSIDTSRLASAGIPTIYFVDSIVSANSNQVSQPNEQLVYGTGSGIGSSSNLIYDGTDITFHGGNIGIDNGQGLYLDGVGDNNWTISRNTGNGEFVTSNAMYLTYSGNASEGLIMESILGKVAFEVVGSNGKITFDKAYTFPTTDGSSGAALVTDGAGNVSWGTPTAGTPALTQNQIAFGDGSNLMTSSSNLTYDGTNVSLLGGSIALDNAQAIYLNSIGDTKWNISRNLGNGKSVISNSINLTYANGPGEGLTMQDNAGNTQFEVLASTGAITFDKAYTFPTADGSTGAALVTDGAGDVSWGTPTAGTPALTQNQIAFGNVSNLMASSSNWTYDGNNVSLHNGNFGIDNAQAIDMNGIGDGNWTFSRNTGTGKFVTSNALTLTHATDPGEGITIQNNLGITEFEILGSTGAITFDTAYTFPTTDGSPGAALVTDGSGNVSWATPVTPETLFTPADGGTITTIVGTNIVNPSGALSTLTVTLPSSPINGQCVELKFTNSIGTITYSGGTVAVSASTNVGVGSDLRLFYDAGTSTWY